MSSEEQEPLLDTNEQTEIDHSLSSSEVDEEQTLVEGELTIEDESNADISQVSMPSDSDIEAVQQLSNSQLQSHYDILQVVGKGAMGEILLAKDQNLMRKVAYKKIHKEIARNKKILSRFLREVQITAQLDHPNIIPIYELESTEDNSLAYTMKLVKGKTLKDLIVETRKLLREGKPLDSAHSLQQRMDYFLDLCDAMHYSHTKGVIHRDLKPANIMIGAYNEVYVMDWGIARLIGGEFKEELLDEKIAALIQPDADEPYIEQTQIGQVLGTPRYMSPQQAAGKNDDLDGSSDQFALGLILFEVITLTPAFSAKDPMELIKKILKVDKNPIKHFIPETPIAGELKAIIHKATALKPYDRYESVDEMAQDIRRYLRGQEVKARPDNLPQKVLRWMSHHRQATIAIVMLVFLLSSSAILGSLYNQQMALAAAHAKEKRINEFLTLVSQQSQKIDTHFLEMKNQVKGLAAVAVQALESGQASEEPHFPQHPFEAPEQFKSKIYKANISLDYPTSGFSPGKSMKDMNGKLEKLLPLRHYFKDMLLRSYTAKPELLSNQDIQTLIGQKGVPIMWAHVSLEEGVIYMYPGIGFNQPSYDARTRPWYKLSARKYGVFWGNPYYDPLSGAILPCTTSLYSKDNQFLGIAGIDLTFKYVIDSLMTLEQYPAFNKSYLLNRKGEVILKTTDLDNKKVMPLTKGFETPLFENKAVVKAIGEKQTGGHVYTNNHQELLAFHRLNTLGWYYVASGDKHKILGDARE